MGCCLPSSIRRQFFSERNTIIIFDQDENLSPDSADFDIHNSLIMFGQDKRSKNFMLTFNFRRNEFENIKLERDGKFFVF